MCSKQPTERVETRNTKHENLHRTPDVGNIFELSKYKGPKETSNLDA